MQLSYSSTQEVGLAGMQSDSGDIDVVSRANPVVAIPFGCAVVPGTDPDKDVKLPTTAAEAAAAAGLALRSQAVECSASGDPQYPVNSSVPVAKRGRFLVKVTTAVVPGDDVYVRFATGVLDTAITQKGSFGKTPDGAAQVDTLTPAAANDTNYDVAIYDDEGKLLKSAQITSDGSATATEICNALRTALGTVAGVTLGGTATLTVTASVLGKAFSVQTSSNIALVHTTANSQTAAKRTGWKFKTTAAAAALAEVEVA